MPRSIWRRFASGEKIDKASLQVIDLKKDQPQQTATIYRIRFLPCGCEAELSHAQIRARMRDRSKKCQVCKSFSESRKMSGLDKAFARVSPRWQASPLVRASVTPGWEWS